MDNKINISFDFDGSIPERGVCCVYQLMDHLGTVIYVGQTKDLATRLKQHIGSSKAPSSFSFKVVNEAQLNNVEAATIARLLPEHNKSIPPNDFYTSKASLNKELAQLIRTFVNELDVDLEIGTKGRSSDKHINAYKALIIKNVISESINECIKMTKDGE